MLTVLAGDAIEQLRTLPSESVQCCVTSPPYWGLRDYGTAEWEAPIWANIASTVDWRTCRHVLDQSTTNKHFARSSTLKGTTTRQENHSSTRNSRVNCFLCGARRIDAQLGLERTPEEYVAKMVEVFREVRRVLRKDGTLWLNLGDSYAGQLGERGNVNGTSPGRAKVWDNVKRPTAKQIGLKPKDLCGIPWRVAFALQADGWWLRSDIIWAKPNPMPESVTDRPTKSHEYLFLLTKSANYFYDSEAIKEKGESADRLQPTPEMKTIRPNDTAWHDNRYAPGASGYGVSANGRNKRSVWTVATAPYPEAHFATYPPDLIKPCIMAGSRADDTVLDPFAGSGTTGVVALELGRKAILIELNPKYCDLIRQRCDVTLGLQLA